MQILCGVCLFSKMCWLYKTIIFSLICCKFSVETFSQGVILVNANSSQHQPVSKCICILFIKIIDIWIAKIVHRLTCFSLLNHERKSSCFNVVNIFKVNPVICIWSIGYMTNLTPCSIKYEKWYLSGKKAMGKISTKDKNNAI